MESCIGGTDCYYIASAYYAYSAGLTAKAAEALGRKEDAERYGRLAREVREAVVREYFTPNGRCAADTQTAYAVALYMDLTPEEMRRVDDAVRISLALNPMGSIQQIEPIRRSTAVYAPPEVVDGKPPVYPYTPIRSSFENAGSIEEMMLHTELQSAVHAMIQRLEYSLTFNPSLLTSPKRKQQVTEILTEAEKYIWRIKEEMRCA